MPRKPRILAALIALVAVAGSPPATAGPRPAVGQESGAPEAPSAGAMHDAWQDLAGRLTPELLADAGFSFDDARRLEWFYTPVDRVGLRIGDLDEEQRHALEALLRSGLGDGGVDQAHQVIQLEEVLFATSGGRAMRNPGNYYLMTFGAPATSGAWGWRFEGHHLSTSFTIVEGRVVAGTPAFFGGNPAHVPDDSEIHAGLRVFGNEQDLGFALLEAFSDAERQRVIIEAEAPRDILTTNAPRAEMGPPEGIAVADMSEAQRELLHELIHVYGRRMNPALLDYQMAKIRAAGAERVHFAWAGGTAPGQGHYYRIHGPTFVIEYDNTQGNANHVHSVWRDFEDDFGYDPLRAHLAADHGLTAENKKSDSALGSDAEIEDDEAAHRRAHERGVPHRH